MIIMITILTVIIIIIIINIIIIMIIVIIIVINFVLTIFLFLFFSFPEHHFLVNRDTCSGSLTGRVSCLEHFLFCTLSPFTFDILPRVIFFIPTYTMEWIINCCSPASRVCVCVCVCVWVCGIYLFRNTLEYSALWNLTLWNRGNCS